MARGAPSESLIWQWNCRGFQRKRALVQQHLTLLDEKPLAIALQESGKAAKLSGYQAFSSDKGDKSRVTTLIKRNIAAIEHEVNSREIEAVLLEILTGRKDEPSVFLLNLYSTPRQRKVRFRALFRKAIEAAGTNPLLIVGDFNAAHPEWGYSKQDPKGRQLWEDAHELGLTLHTDPSSPSRVGNSVCADTSPDLTFSKNVTDLKWTNSEWNFGSDHFILALILKKGVKTRRARQPRITDWELFRDKRDQSATDKIENIDKWTKTLARHVEEATKTLDGDDAPEIADSKLLHIRCDEMEGGMSLAKTWGLLRHLLDPTNSKTQSGIRLSKARHAFKGTDAEFMNKLTALYIGDTRSTALPEYNGAPNEELDAPFTEAEVRAEILGLKTKSAPGPDGITNKILRNLDDASISALTEYMQEIWTKGVLPSQWNRPTARTWTSVCKVTPKSLKIIGYFAENPLHSNKPSAWRKKPRGVKTSSPASNRGGAGPRCLGLCAEDGEPLHIAAEFGNESVVKLLLNRKDVRDFVCKRNANKKNCLDMAIEEEHRDVVEALLKSRFWKELLQNSTDSEQYGTHQTPLRNLIRTMPDLATLVFNSCVTVEAGSDEDPNKSVTYQYQFLDDAFCGCGADDSGDESDSDSDSPAPGKSANERRRALLGHELCKSLLLHKWESYGRYVYYSTMSIYLLFLGCLTSFAMGTPAPCPLDFPHFNTTCSFISRYNTCAVIGEASDEGQYMQTDFARKAKIIIFMVSLIFLLKEVFQMYNTRWNYLDLENLSEWSCYVCSLLFVFNFTDCSASTGVPEPWQWHLGVVSVFLSWALLVIYIRKLPFLGIYVVMFTNVLSTFCQFFMVFFLFIVAFALTFFALLQNQAPFDTPWKAIMKTTVMMVGEIEYDSIFTENVLPYETSSYILMALFIVLHDHHNVQLARRSGSR
ncbi:hypothetical protein HPB52_007528 [Rhipicephalus sanguineus]|uniref:Ion transport domain-containing protein n=1 Tax=Rhipicephalus sanguineus TaxID=34632 RepID=A0A9D4PP32_RHISA|nr:hypothetical protein HPB52_007528 [Rhipicephalus sanguineus]